MGFNIIEFILVSSVTIRRMIWFFTAIFIIVILWKSLRHRKATDLDELPLLMLPCGFEWFWREYAYRIVGEITNPYAYWWERRLAPALILVFVLFAGVIHYISFHRVFKKNVMIYQIIELIRNPDCPILIECMLGFDPEIDLGDYSLFHGPCSSIPKRLLHTVVESWGIENETLVLHISKEELSEDELRYFLHLYENLSDDACADLLSHTK